MIKMETLKAQDIENSSTLLSFFKKRKHFQLSRYGNQSATPGYEIPVSLSPSSDLKNFKVAVVQTLMPYLKDMSLSHPTQWKPAYRARHTAHLSAMCQLISQQVKASLIAQNKHKSKHGAHLDLIVFPELSIHPDDMFHLERLSDLTKATIFAGQTFILHPYKKAPINRGVWIVRQATKHGRNIQRIYQGKKYPMSEEQKMGVIGHRPYQAILALNDSHGNSANLTASICFDATDLKLTADFREITDCYVVSALNRDITTFDNMAASLQFQMYQHVIIANSGEFGGSTVQAPYKERYDKLIAHVHGSNQAAVSLFSMDLTAFKNTVPPKPEKAIKSPPAGFNGRTD
jgi:hypothetical protein